MFYVICSCIDVRPKTDINNNNINFYEIKKNVHNLDLFTIKYIPTDVCANIK